MLRFSVQPGNFVSELLQTPLDLPQHESGKEFDQSLKL